MPANLPPDYYRLVEKMAETREFIEKAGIIEEMLAVIPKHKGTDHLRGDLRRKLALFKQKALEKKGGSKHASFTVERSGAGQFALLGRPNSGKSAIVSALTNAPTKVADYPFATHAPVPGMMHFEDIQIQLVDLPPFCGLDTDFRVLDAAKKADRSLIVVDSADNPFDAVESILSVCEEKHLHLSWDPPPEMPRGTVWKRALLVFTKIDMLKIVSHLDEVIQMFESRIPSITISSQKPADLKNLQTRIFDMLDIIRIYTQKPGRKADLSAPFVVPAGSTIGDFARVVHKEIAETLKSARIWGSARYPGQHVERSYILSDGDIVQLSVK